MMFKFHWGWGAGIAYTIFAVSLLTVLFLSSKWQVDLEDKDYYQKELNYQKQIDKIQRTQSLPDKFVIQISSNNISIKFPKFDSKMLIGKIHFYRPSDSKLDFMNDIKLDDENKMIIPLNTIQKGLWKLKIEFSVDGIEYYHEEAIKV